MLEQQIWKQIFQAQYSPKEPLNGAWSLQNQLDNSHKSVKNKVKYNDSLFN